MSGKDCTCSPHIQNISEMDPNCPSHGEHQRQFVRDRCPKPDALSELKRVREESAAEIGRLKLERDQALDQRRLKMFVWHRRPSYLAVAQAHSVEEARKLLISNEQEAIGESGDGSCMVRDEAREYVREMPPTYWYGPHCEFVLTDSAELEEQTDLTRTLEKQLKERDSQIRLLQEEIERGKGK